MPLEISNHQGEGTCEALHSDLIPVGAPQLPLVLGNLFALPPGLGSAIPSAYDTHSPLLPYSGPAKSSDSAYEALLPEATLGPGAVCVSTA